jgi:hypothetical protein
MAARFRGVSEGSGYAVARYSYATDKLDLLGAVAFVLPIEHPRQGITDARYQGRFTFRARAIRY